MKKKHLFLLIMILCIGLFIYAQSLKSKYGIYKERITTEARYEYNFRTAANSSYLISIWGCDEETGLQQWASLNFNYEVLVNNVSIKKKQILASESEEKGGIRRAQSGSDVTFVSETNTNAVVICKISEGDYVDIEIFKDLPNNLYWLPVFSILGALLSGFLYLKYRTGSK